MTYVQNQENYRFSMFLIDYTYTHLEMLDKEVYRCACIAWERYNNKPYNPHTDVLCEKSNARLFRADLRKALRMSFPTS